MSNRWFSFWAGYDCFLGFECLKCISHTADWQFIRTQFYDPAKVWIVHVWAVLIGGLFCHYFPGLPKQDSGHWWSSFFFGKQPGMGSLAEEAQQKWVTCFWVQKTLNLHNLLNLSFFLTLTDLTVQIRAECYWWKDDVYCSGHDEEAGQWG